MRLLLSLLVLGAIATAGEKPLDEAVTHGHLKSGGVRLHYAALGDKGPLVVFLHGFPDYWYSWRHQMRALARDHHVVAFDLRGYNKSDQPKGVENYAMRLLIGDVAAVIRHFGHEKAIVVGHDWGGAIAWQFAMHMPQMTERLVILNVPHPNGLVRELEKNATQKKNSQYARNFQADGAHKGLTAEGLAAWVRDADARAKYVEAFRRSDFEAMLNYYKANYPRTGGKPAAPPAPAPRVKAPVLVIHGLKDPYLLAAGHNDTWEWLEKDLTLVTVPDAGHFVQQDAPEFVTRTITAWLGRDGAPAAKSRVARSVNAKCPFSGKPIRADSLTTYKGRVVGFCNPGCRDKFAGDPETYLAQHPELRGK